MKHTIIGMGLILYALFLTPCYVEPSDLVISSGWIAATTAMFGPEMASVIIPLWMATGYIALLFGVICIGTSILRRVGISRTLIIFKHPWIASLIIAIICIITSYYFYINYTIS